MKKHTAMPRTAPHATSIEDLGQMVRAKRHASGIRIDDAAAFSKVSVDLLSRLENGKTGVATTSLLKVLDALGLALLVVDKASVSHLINKSTELHERSRQ